MKKVFFLTFLFFMTVGLVGAVTMEVRPSLPDVETLARDVAALGIYNDPSMLLQFAREEVNGTDGTLPVQLKSHREPLDQPHAALNPVIMADQMTKETLQVIAGDSCGYEDGYLSGRVLSDEGVPLEGIAVFMVSSQWDEYGDEPAGDLSDGSPIRDYWGTLTDEDGYYRVYFDYPGSYYLMAYDYDGNYLYQYYDHADSWEEAAILDLAEGETREDLDFDLDQAGFIEGTVLNEEGIGISNIFVMAYNPLDPNWYYYGFAVTDDSGSYKMGGLFPGQYDVMAYDAFSFYAESTFTDPVQVESGVTTGPIDFLLTATDTGIRGKITDPEGSPMNSVVLWAFGGNDYDLWGYGMTDPGGHYRMGLQPGDYFLVASDQWGDYLLTYYPGTTSWMDAEVIRVEEGTVLESVDFSMLRAGRISGSLADSTSGNPLPFMMVEVFGVDGTWITSGYSDDRGYYSIGGLDTGLYLVYAWDWSSYYAPEWYENRSHFYDADSVEVTAGRETTGIDFFMDLSGGISGQVVDADTGQPLPDIFLEAWSYGGPFDVVVSFGYGFSDEEGRFSVMGLTTDHYFLLAYDWMGNYLLTYFDGVTDIREATQIPVTSGEMTTGIKMRLTAGGRITGMIRDALTGDSLSGFYSLAFDRNLNWGGFGYTDESGQYSIPGLPEGDYLVMASDLWYRYPDLWYENTEDILEADPVHTGPGMTTSGIDFDMPAGGRITGHVRDTEGNPIPWVTLWAESDGSITKPSSYTYTDEDGYYELTGLNSGRYYVGLYLSNGSIHYYPDAPDPSTATPLNVDMGDEISGIDFDLFTGGTVCGLVLDEDTGLPIPWAEVLVFTEEGLFGSWGYTDEDGSYRAMWLPEGSYKVVAYAGCYAEEWYLEQQTFESADTVRVTYEGDSSGIDFTLEYCEECCWWPEDRSESGRESVPVPVKP